MKLTKEEDRARREEIRQSRDASRQERIRDRLVRIPAEQIVVLNKRLGKGVGASKERERLKKPAKPSGAVG